MKAPKKNVLHSIIGIILIAIFILSGCMPDAERDNPFDPQSDRYRPKPEGSGTLSGNVSKVIYPFEGIAGVTVTLSAPGGSGVTGSDGSYLITNIPDGSYLVTAHKSGYSRDSTTVEITAGQTNTAHFSLDGLPYFLETSIISEHTVTTSDEIFIHFEAWVDDPDGLQHIDSAIVSIHSFAFENKLNTILNTERYFLTVAPEEITGGTPELLVGKEVVFSVWDKIGKKTDSFPTYLVRVIRPSPTIIAPNEEESMDSRRLLMWESFTESVNFAFTYSVDVKIPFSSGWYQESIPPDSTSITVSEPLDPQLPHRWSIWAVDEYGNTSKSPYVTFYVEGGK